MCCEVVCPMPATSVLFGCLCVDMYACMCLCVCVGGVGVGEGLLQRMWEAATVKYTPHKKSGNA